MVNIPTKPPLSSNQTAIDEDETGLKYSDGDGTGMPAVSKPSASNTPAVSKPSASKMPAVSKPSPSNTPAVSKPSPSNTPAVSKPRVSSKLPHNLDEILKDADKQIDRSSTQKIYDQLSSGIYLKQKKQKFWVDKNLKNCFMLYARSLEVIWGDTPSYWYWPTLKDQDSSEASTFEAAELLNVCWLQIYVNFDTFKLSPATTYEVVFVVMIKDPSYGLETPVKLRLTLPDKTVQLRRENLNVKQRGIWIEIPVGIFTTSANQNTSKDMEVSLYEYEDGNGRWKRGLVIKGVCIRPKINP